MPGTASQDVRLNLRSLAQGHAVIPFRSNRISAELVNVSLGGALLHAREPGTLPGKNTRLSAEVRLAGSERWFEIPVRVTRSDPARSFLALEFIAVDPDLEDAIADVVLESLDAAASPRVLLVDLDPGRRRRMTRLLRMTGCAPIEAATPLEAIRTCEQSSIPVAGAALVDGGAQDFDELATFLRRTYPDIEVTRIDPPGGHFIDELRLLARAVRQR